MPYFKINLEKKIWSLNIKRIIHPSNLKSKCCKLQNPNEHLTLSNVQGAMNKVQRKKYLQVLIMEFGFQISLHSSSWPLWIPPLLNVDALQILLSYLNFDAHTPSFLLSTISFQKLKSMDSKTIRKSKWTLKTKIVIVRIPTIPSNSTKSLILLPLNSTKSLISNNSNLNRIYYPKRKVLKVVLAISCYKCIANVGVGNRKHVISVTKAS